MYLAQRRKACAGPRSGDAKLGVCFSSEISFFAPFRLRIRHSGESRNPGAAVRGRVGGKIFPRVSGFVSLGKPGICFRVMLASVGGSIMDMLIDNIMSLIAILSILLVYTPLKRRTHLCMLIGAFPGAAPVLMGWSASQGSLAPQAWLLYATLFLWQFPHFLAIAWLYREDYAQARMLMLPNGDSEGGNTFRQLWIASLALIAATLVTGL